TGRKPANVTKSTEASVWPTLRKTPPFLYFNGNTWPGLLKSSGLNFGDARASMFSSSYREMAIMSLNLKSKLKPLLNFCRTFSNAPLSVGSKCKSKFIVAQHTKTIGLGCFNYLVISIEDTAHEVEKCINYPKLYHNPVATCNGLMLLLFEGSRDEDTDTKTSPGEALWNPTTNELKILPPSPATLNPSLVGSDKLIFVDVKHDMMFFDYATGKLENIA
ncbi:F-box and associated interaction domains-containing protein, partial [Striga asiatica]